MRPGFTCADRGISASVCLAKAKLQDYSRRPGHILWRAPPFPATPLRTGNARWSLGRAYHFLVHADIGAFAKFQSAALLRRCFDRLFRQARKAPGSPMPHTALLSPVLALCARSALVAWALHSAPAHAGPVLAQANASTPGAHPSRHKGNSPTRQARAAATQRSTSEETRGERDRRLTRECRGRPNAGACLGYVRP